MTNLVSFRQSVEKYAADFADMDALKAHIESKGGDTSNLPDDPGPPAKPESKLNVQDHRPGKLGSAEPKYNKTGTGNKPKDIDKAKVPALLKSRLSEFDKSAEVKAGMPDARPSTPGSPPKATAETGFTSTPQPMSAEDYRKQSSQMTGVEHGEQLQMQGDQLQDQDLNDHLESAGVFEGTPQQISQFAQMLGIDVWGAIATPQQLMAAITAQGKHDSLYEVLRQNGLMSAKPASPGGQGLAGKAGKAIGEFARGFERNSPTGVGRRAVRGAFDYLTNSRFQAEQYQGEYPGYQPAQVNAIQPPKAPGPGPVFTAKKNNPDADFWIARRGSSKTVGKPHREFAPESIGISVNREHMDPGYVWHVMDALHQTGHWAGKATGTTNLVNINNGHIKELLGMDVFQPATKEPGPPVEGPIPPLPKEKPAEQSYGEKEVENIKESYREQPGIAMPTDNVDNEDAGEGDQLGLFGEGKKKKVPKKYKQENPQGKARAKPLFDKDEDPDQKTLFGSFGEAVDHYAANQKKK